MATNNAANNPTAASGKVLQGQGVGTASNFSTATYPSTATSTGTLLRADGTNWSATTSTYPNTNAANTLLYASSANTMAALATANNGVLKTDGSGVPSIGLATIVVGGTNATSYTQSNGVITYNGTSLVNYAGPQIDSSGRYTNTSQPSFFAYKSGNSTNVTGNGTIYTVVCGNTLFNVGSGFNTGTGVFTAPIAGTYQLNAATCYLSITTTFTQIWTQLVCSTAGTFRGNVISNQSDANPTSTVSVIVQLAAGETVTMQTNASSGTQVVGVTGNAGTIYQTYVTGQMIS